MRTNKQDRELSGKCSNIEIYTIHLEAPHRQIVKKKKKKIVIVQICIVQIV